MQAEELFKYQSTHPLPIIRYKKVHISKDHCQKDCMAKKVIDHATPALFKKIYIGPNGVNPTSPLCRVVGGGPKIYFYKDKRAVSICLFPDGSFVLGWELMNHIERHM